MTHVRCRSARLAGSVAALVVVAALTSVVAAPTVSASSPGTSIAHTRMLIERLSTKLSHDEEMSETLGNEYDKDVSTLQRLKNEISHNKAVAALKQTDLTTTTKTLVRDTIRSYVDGVSDGQGIPLLNLNVSVSDATQVYEQEAIGNLNQMEHKLVREKKSLHEILQAEDHERKNASEEVHQVRVITFKNQANTIETHSVLRQISANLIREVVAYEINVAVAAARANNAAGVNNAIAAATAIGGQAAANEVIAAVDRAVPPKVTTVSGTPAGTAAGEAAVHAAESEIGVPYVWGDETPGHGFDCSGLTQWSWGRAGFYIPRTAAEQYQALTPVPLTELRPGDLLFYYNLDGDDQVDHVVMYVGSGPYGTQTIIAAAHTGTDVGYEQLFTYGLIGAGRP